MYRNSTDTFLAILKSFHILQDSSSKDALGTANGSGTRELAFVNWHDPHEGAFSLSVPEGWQVAGGAYRLSAEDARYSVVMVSPDGRVRASLGDSMIGAFTQPSKALSLAGLGEGSFQNLGDGTKVEVLRYNTGQQYARSYVDTLVSRQCGNLQIDSSNAREDVAVALSKAAASDGFTDTLFTAGEVSFTCDVDGRAAKGKYIAATIRMAPGVSSLWFVYRLYGYIAFAGREQEGEKVLGEIRTSARFNPDWESRPWDALNAAAQQDMDRLRQIRERAEQNIADDQKQISEMTANADEQRQKFYDQIDRKRQNSVVGKLSVVDPETGTQYRVSAFGDYHYLTDDGYFYTTNSAGRPGSNLRAMVALP